MATRGGYRPGAGRKPNPKKPKVIATTRLPARRDAAQDIVSTMPAEAKKPEGIDAAMLANALPAIEEMLQRHARKRDREAPRSSDNTPFKLPWFPAKARPTTRQMAMDDMPIFADAAQGWLAGEAFAAEGLVFLGYPYLAELAQRPEYRTMAETIADDATREWISFDVTGDEKTERENRNKDPEGYEERQNDPDEMKKRVKASGKEDRVKELTDDQERLEVRDRLYWASTYDSFMGRSHLYLQIGDADFEKVQGEMASPIGNSRDEMSKGKVTPETPLKYIKTVEPVWTYPMSYNAINPLAPEWYNPQRWYVMGREIDLSRLITFVSRPVPDMLKPAYAFGGLPLSQIAKPYVDIWLDTRQSIADLIKSFSTMVLQTDLATQITPQGAAGLMARVAMYNMLRDNQGLFVTNKNTEDFKNVSAPLGGLHELQAQAQEHMLSVARIPAVKFTGIQPSGLNASSDGEIKVYDDTIKAYQKRSFDPNLTRIINFQMLSLFGDVDPEITHRWNPLRQLTDAEKADQKKKEADWFGVLTEMGAFSPAEVRKVVINDPESPFAGLDPDDVPEPPQPEPGEGEEGPDDEEDGGEGPETAGGPGGAQDRDPFGATDEWREGDHPRAPDGKFGSGAGSSSSKGGGSKQTLKMPQFGLTHSPSSSAYMPRAFPKSSGKADDASSVVVFHQAMGDKPKKLNGKAFKKFSPPKDWADVSGQAKIDEPEIPEIPKGMTLSSGTIVREPDGRVWLVRPAGGYGGYDQTFPKGGVETGLSPQANAIKETFEESGLKVKIVGFAGDHEGDTSLTRYYYAEREGGDPTESGWETEGVVLAPPDQLAKFLNRTRDKKIAQALASGGENAEGEARSSAPELDPADLKKEGGKLGSNEGGVFTDEAGNKFYIKRPESKAHVANELAAARLYQLAGVNTLDYRPVKGGNHVATAWENLDKNRISQMSDAERKAAAGDFAVHAWLSNWDAAGTGGDNQGVRNGKPVTLDVGGSLRYRAQGGEKGSAFGPKVSEIETMRDKSKSPDAARLFGKMTDEEIAESAARVTSIPDEKIREAAGDDSLADVLIARKKDLAKRYGLAASDEAMMIAADEANFEEGKHPRDPDGKFASGGGGFASKKEHVAHLLKQGTTTKEILAATGWPSVSVPQQAAAAGLKLEKYVDGGVTKYKGVPMTDAEKAELKKAAIAAKAKKIEEPKPAPQKVEIKEPPPPAITYPTPTEAEKQKAKKSVALQMQYVPGEKPTMAGGAPYKKAEDLIKAFNDKWAGKEGLSDEQLAQKVNNFKSLGTAIGQLASQEKAHHVEIAAQAKAAQAEAAKAKAEKAKAEAKAAAAQNSEYIKSLGISETQAEGMVALAKMLGKGGKDLAAEFKAYEQKAKSYGYPISGFEAALIANYSDGGYGAINAALRSGKWTPAQHVYVGMVNKALKAMPTYKSATPYSLTRNTKLSAEQQAAYAHNHVIQEAALMSTSTGDVFSGNTTFKVTAIGKRASSIKKLSHHGHENEVLFAAKTYFHVDKVEGKPGGSMTIHMTEWEDI